MCGNADLAGRETVIDCAVSAPPAKLGRTGEEVHENRRQSMHLTWQHMFALGLPIAEKIIRPVIVYVFLIVGLRLAGKRELAQLNPFDLVVLLTLSNTVQNAIIGEDNSVTGGLIGAATLLLINYAVIRFLFTHERMDRIVEGDSDALIENGILNRAHLKRELLTQAELETAAHRQGFASLDEIERAAIEPGGTFLFVGKKPSPEEVSQKAVTDRLDAMSRQLAEIKGKLLERMA
jgi:uncharacterized membrane protein YcaP (DUF421 family)